jgi:uncharacterized membrane protein YciS (DUF1049 family)
MGTILSLTFEIGKYRILSLYQSRQSSPSTIHYFIQVSQLRLSSLITQLFSNGFL